MSVFGNGRRILAELGIEDEIAKNGYQMAWLKILKPNGNIVGAPVDLASLAKVGKPVITIERANLHEVLVKCLSKTTLRLGTTIQEFKNEETSVKVTFSDGSKDEFDLVVAADGIRSAMRESLFGKDELEFYGWSARVFWAPVGTPVLEGVVCISKESAALAIYPTKNKNLGVIYEYNPLRADHQAMDMSPFTPYLLNHGWTQAHIDSIIKESTEGHQLYDHLRSIPLGKWYKGRIALLGDARHGFSPIIGMGGTMALEDAFVLADELSKITGADPKEALKAYAHRRGSRLYEVKMMAKLSEQFYFVSSPIKRMIRDFIAWIFPKHAMLAELERIIATKI
jgi:2-polyprenyl-6-methoxyphenol hydroxylase-like FAD-dependent oxidoreductase